MHPEVSKLSDLKAKSCLLIGQETLLVISPNLLVVLCLKTGEKIKDLRLDSTTFRAILSPNQKNIFLATFRGLKMISWPELLPIKTICPTSKISTLCLLPNLKKILFNDHCDIVVYDIASNSFFRLARKANNWIVDIISTNDESKFFTISQDLLLIKWCTETWIQIQSAQTPSEGVCLALGKSQEFIYVGTIDGFVLVYVSENLNLLFSHKVHTKLISRILIRSEEDFLDETISISHDGCIGKSIISSLAIQVSPTDLLDAAKIDDHHLICCSSSGIYSFKFEKQTLFHVYNTLSVLIQRQISGVLKSPFYLTNRRVQVVSLLLSLRYKYHRTLIDCFVPHGLKIIVSPCLDQITRGHYNKGSLEGPARIVTKDFVYKFNSGERYDDEPQYTMFIPFRLKIVFMSKFS